MIDYYKKGDRILKTIDEKLAELGYELEVLGQEELIYSREEHNDLHCVYLHKHNGLFCIDSYYVNEDSKSPNRSSYCGLTHKEAKLFVKRVDQLSSYTRFLNNIIRDLNHD